MGCTPSSSLKAQPKEKAIPLADVIAEPSAAAAESTEAILLEVLSQTEKQKQAMYPTMHGVYFYNRDIVCCTDALVRQQGGRRRATIIANDRTLALCDRVVVCSCL